METTAGSEPQDWPYLDDTVLTLSRSFQICLTCQHFRVELEEPGWPLLLCHHHRGLIANAHQFSRCCSVWQANPDALQSW